MFRDIRLAAAIFVLSLPGAASSAGASDEVIFRLATVGDSRAEPGDTALRAQDAIWLQSSRVLARMIREMQVQHPQALVFNGDMIYGYSGERAVLDRQYAFWRGMMAQLLEAGTYVLPVPGNHEVQIKTKNERGDTVKRASISGEQAWRANMGDLILDTTLWQELTHIEPAGWSIDNAPAAGSDGIATDQRQLSYSFDAGDVHLAVINTDPVGDDATAPVQWLAADLAAARSRGARHLFVFGHKMAYPYAPAGSTETHEHGLDVHAKRRNAFWDVIEAQHATYFCGHEHVYHASQPRLANGGAAWQVIVGSGGSPFSVPPGASANPDDRTYAWAEVAVRRSGGVSITVRGFDDHFGPTRILKEWTIEPASGTTR